MSDFESKRIETGKRLGIHPEAIPRHIAIIMDGNGRWATEQDLPRFRGHEQGGKTVEIIAKHCVNVGIECLTLYSFSQQNWKRPPEEIDFLMYLYSSYLEGIRPSLEENNVRLLHFGSRKKLPDSVLDALDETIQLTSHNTGMALGLALNYGAREEIIQAVKRISTEYLDKKINLDQIDESTFSNYLYTAGCQDPDLLIRTSGELRISNFLLWQISYSEFYVTDTYWPDFSPKNLDEAIITYAKRSRRFGDVKAKTTL